VVQESELNERTANRSDGSTAFASTLICRVYFRGTENLDRERKWSYDSRGKTALDDAAQEDYRSFTSLAGDLRAYLGRIVPLVVLAERGN
jgi:hypothetical protein